MLPMLHMLTQDYDFQIIQNLLTNIHCYFTYLTFVNTRRAVQIQTTLILSYLRSSVEKPEKHEQFVRLTKA